MALWDAGVVVVAAAGNSGPDAMTVGVPGNVPYIITVGAMSDGATTSNPGDDFLTSFSAAGPTYEGFVKPEVVAPGGHMLGVVDPIGLLPSQHPRVARRLLFLPCRARRRPTGAGQRRGSPAAGVRARH